MSSEGDSAAASLKDIGGRDQTRKDRVAQAPGFTRRTPINLSGGLNELTDGTVCSVDVATGAAIGPYRKSRLDGPGTQGTQESEFESGGVL